MTRGKYAAKANGQRAEAAANTATSLRSQLDEERRGWAAESAAFKTEVLSLQGKLVREVRELAASEVERVRIESRAALEAERAQAHKRLMDVAALFRRNDYGAAFMADLADLLGVKVGDLVGGDEALSRENRRFTSSEARRAAAHAHTWWATKPDDGEDYGLPR